MEGSHFQLFIYMPPVVLGNKFLSGVENGRLVPLAYSKELRIFDLENTFDQKETLDWIMTSDYPEVSFCRPLQYYINCSILLFHYSSFTAFAYGRFIHFNCVKFEELYDWAFSELAVGRKDAGIPCNWVQIIYNIEEMVFIDLTMVIEISA